MYKYFIALTFVFVTSCSNVSMYEGKKLAKSELSLLYIEERPNRFFTSIDGKSVNFFPDGQILEFKPGVHEFTVQISNYVAFGTGSSITYSTNNTVKVFTLKLDMQAGYSYHLDFMGVNVRELPDQLCFIGEPHNAIGSSVNITGEYRQMSQTAQSYGCAKSQ